jgi:DNA recombination protein RmuC
MNLSSFDSSTLANHLPQGVPLVLLLVIPVVAAFFLLLAVIVLLFVRSAAVGRLRRVKKQLVEAEQQLADRAAEARYQELRAAKLLTLLKNDRRHATAKLRLLEEAREELRLQFSHLAQQIFEEKSRGFSELNREKLDAILSPFNRQLLALQQEIQEVYRHDSRERLSLKNEILQLRELNRQVNQEAINLTRALQGDKRVQGNWGEMVLEKVLERSGLRRDHEYHCQGGFRDADNRLQKPDVIIHLPEGKDIIIDSKVSLVSWQHYVNSSDEGQRAKHLADHIKAVREHILALGHKDYPRLLGVHSFDFVLLFMPIEAAFHAAFETDDKLLDQALASNIVVVTPTTLLATLRSIENIWQFERQSRNSLEIARRAGLMFDKFRLFIEDLDKLGRQLALCQSSYESAMGRLTRGRGNLVAQAEQLRDLGIQVKKELPRTITDCAETTRTETMPTPESRESTPADIAKPEKTW